MAEPHPATPELLTWIAQALRTEVSEVTHRLLPDDDAVLAVHPVRGGGTLIVARDGTMLWAGSSISTEQHLKEFRTGRRTPPELFSYVPGPPPPVLGL